MTPLPPPLRFLVGVCAGWTCARAGILWLSLSSTGGAPWAPHPAPRAARSADVELPQMFTTPLPTHLRRARFEPAGSPANRATSAALESSPPAETVPRPARLAEQLRPQQERAASTNGTVPAPGTASTTSSLRPPSTLLPPLPALPTPRGARPWSLSAWLFVRDGGSQGLAPGGMLGGSQAGARATYRIAGTRAPLALSLRVSTPLADARGAEAAGGLDWQPRAALPVHLLVERRQKLGPAGRSAFAANAYGGFSEVRLGRFRLDAYAQAGAVGVKRPELFADGMIRAAAPLDRAGRLRIGAGAWAAAQAHVSRLDVGPHVELRLPVPGAGAVLSGDWRFRVAGTARPASGPALTLAADF